MTDVTRRKMRWTKEEDLFVIENSEKMTAREMANELGRSLNSVKKRYGVLNIKKFTDSNCNKRYEYNKDYFETIDTEEKAYWLGFICADGCIVNKGNGSYRLKLTLKNSDKNHLKKFADDLASNLEIKEKKVKLNGKEYLTSELIINSTKMCHDLMKLGVGVRKTYDMTMPTIDEHLKKHFVRGFIDGDGSLYLSGDNKKFKSYSIEIVGYTCQIMKDIQYFFDDNNIESKIYQKREHNDKLGIYSKENIKKAIKLLYVDSNVHLDRKYKKSMEMLNYFESA